MRFKLANFHGCAKVFRQPVKTIVLVGALEWGSCPAIRAQDASLMNIKVFQEGAVVLVTGNILTGGLQLYPERGVLRIVCTNDSTYTLPARLVRGFAAKDDPTQLRKGETYVTLQRIFRTFPLPPGKKNSPVVIGFYEQLNQGPGPTLLLRREHIPPCEVAVLGNNTGANGLRNTITSNTYPCKTIATLFLSTVAGEVVVLRKPQDVLDYLPSEAPKLRNYMAENKLSYANLRDLSFLVNYANTLVKKSP